MENIRHPALFLLLTVCTVPACSLWDGIRQHGIPSSLLQQTATPTSEDTALLGYVQRLETRPDDSDALLQIGKIHEGRGNHELARTAFSMAYQQTPDNTEVQEHLGLIELEMKNWKEAGRYLSPLAGPAQTNWRVLNGMGLMEDHQGHHQEAQAYFRRALAARPEHAQILCNLGYSQYLDGHPDEAILSLDRAIALAPHLEQAWLDKGFILAQQDRYDASLEAFLHALAPADAHNNLGYILMKKGHTDMAREHLERAIELSPVYHQLANENLQHLRSLAW